VPGNLSNCLRDDPVPGLVPGTYVLNVLETKTWVAGMNPATGSELIRHEIASLSSQ